MRLADRIDAGRQLAALLRENGVGDPDTIVLGLPRGGVPVAFEVATALDLPLDVIIVRKLGVPHQPELAMGAIGEDGIRTLNQDIVTGVGVGSEDLAAVEARERAELQRRAELFRGDRPRISLAGRTALIIDDGIATGSTVRAACRVARAQGAKRVVVATPVAPPETVRRLAGDADDVYCVHTPRPFWAIGQFYRDFTQTRDDEVRRLLDQAASRSGISPGAGDEERME
jgi:putative phosphoribosyl transferase